MSLRIAWVVLLTVALAPAGSAHAQFADVSIQWGATLGFNLASLQSDEVDVRTRTAFTGGLVAQIDGPGPLSLQPELLFAQKGGAVSTTAEGNGEVRYGANYVDLPVAVRVDGPRIQMTRPYLLAGGFGGLKIFERQTAGGGEIRFPIETETSFFRRFNAGALIGLGARLSLGEGRLDVEVRYSRGLVDVAQNLEEQAFELAPFPRTAETETWGFLVRFGL